MTRIELSRRRDAVTLTFCSESGINVFNSELMAALGNAVESLLSDQETRFVVFRGSGRTFVAGADIREMSDMDAAAARTFSEQGRQVFDMIEALPQITFAAINGPALGGGCELALACDFRIMAARATIGQPETRLGLIPGWGATARLARIVGLSRAKKLMLGGEAITAERAAELGLADEVVHGDEALDQALACMFAHYRYGSPEAIARVKRALRSGDESGQFAECFTGPAAREGMCAFLEKRAAAWMEPN